MMTKREETLARALDRAIDDNEKLHAEIARLVNVSQTAWQPIETAPKDGMCFLACTGNWMTVCCWNKHRDDWCTNGPGYAPYGADERPTHWMTLPEAPALSSAQCGDVEQ